MSAMGPEGAISSHMNGRPLTGTAKGVVNGWHVALSGRNLSHGNQTKNEASRARARAHGTRSCGENQLFPAHN